MSIPTDLLGTIPAVIGGREATVEGTEAGEWIIGTEPDSVMDALGGDDFVQGLAGRDAIDAGDGNDTVLAGQDDDIIVGGTGDDVMRGDAGADRFLFDPSQTEGDDSIVDFRSGQGDVIALSAAGLASLGLEEFSGAALDESDLFNLVEDAETGDLVIEHPGGTITLNGVPFAEEGQEPPTFAELESAGRLTVVGLVQGTDGGEELTAGERANVIDAGDGNDTITPRGGNDIITTGGGSDTVNIDASNPDEGDDVITDFSVPSGPGATGGDSINFALEDILAADPDLPAADGDATSLSLDDFESSENWSLESSEDGNALLVHPNGSVELVDVAADDLEFADLITIDGEEISEPIPVEDGTDGDDVADGDDGTDGDAADGDDGTGGDDVADGGDDTDGDAADGGDDTDGDAADDDDGTDGDDDADGDGDTDGGAADGDGDTGDDGADGDDDVAGDEDSAEEVPESDDVAETSPPDPTEEAMA